MTFRIPLVRRTPARRTVTALVLAGAAFTGLTACTLWAPQDTLYIEEASVGPSATVGDVFVGNAVLVSGGDDTANLVVTLVNEGSDTQHVQLSPQGGQSISVTLKPRQTRQLGDPPDDLSSVTGLDAKPGSLTTVTVTSAGNTVGLQVPVVTGSLQPYGTLTPSPSS
ncbi:hypothetical protein [Leifsonia virtsii]|uniref:Lipoprotein n=1 Tax=Leifsonia virtsii TaxID=3035915 RepID=A0ABT8IXS1_9MICO|nr:hypothetical protein [Leifsonia virtsii]MDN4597618.1 hypothetical protein [Leifsonia virtsii]